MSDVNTLAQDALLAAKLRGMSRTASRSTSALVSLHARLLAGEMAPPNLSRDKDGVCVDKKKEKEEFKSEAAGIHSALLSTAAPKAEQKMDAKKSMGKGWFDIEPVQMTEGLKKDIKMITMRNYLDPKRFYKKADKIKTVLGVGTVIEGPAEYKSSRMTKKERKSNFLDEILADQELKSYAKRKYSEIQTQKENTTKKFRKQQHKEKGGKGKRKQLRAYF